MCPYLSSYKKKFFFSSSLSKGGERGCPVGEICISLSPSLEVTHVTLDPPFKINDLGRGRVMGHEGHA